MQVPPNSNPTRNAAVPGAGSTLAGMWPWLPGLCALSGLAGLGVGLGFGWAQGDGLRRFLHAYLAGYCFFLSISLGALFFVALQHAVRAGWSVAVRRLAEFLAANMPCLVMLFVPIILSVLRPDGGLYAWAARSAPRAGQLPAWKTAYYLNPALFTLRAGVYFVVWLYLARFFLRHSLEQDHSADPALSLRMERFSPVALLLLAFTTTFAAVDWLMSLQPAWFSTIFGVYYFAGAALGAVAALILLAALLQASGRIRNSITTEHYHDLGKLLLGFVVFWGYIAFSQYMLIWYANIPEETIWYLARQTGAWKWVSLVLLFGHLLIPFFGLLSRAAKRNKAVVGFWAAWLLAAHWLDLYWLVMPSLHAAHGAVHGSAGAISAAPRVWPGVIELGTLVGIGGIYAAGLLWTIGRRALVPRGDPRLAESLAFENT